MDNQRLDKTIELNKKIAYANNYLDTLQKFLCTMKVSDIRITTPDDLCLQYILDRKEIEAIMTYLITENMNKKFTLTEQIKNL